MFSMANCALYCHVYYGFIQTIPRQITGDNDRIIETIELLRLLLLCGLDCDIFNLISARVRGCLAVQEVRAKGKIKLPSLWTDMNGSGGEPLVLEVFSSH